MNKIQSALIEGLDNVALENNPLDFYDGLLTTSLDRDTREFYITEHEAYRFNRKYGYSNDGVRNFHKSPAIKKEMLKARRFLPVNKHKAPEGKKTFSAAGLLSKNKNFAFGYGDKVLVFDFDPKYSSSKMSPSVMASLVQSFAQVFNTSPMFTITPSGGVHIPVRMARGCGGKYVNHKMSAVQRSFIARKLRAVGFELPDADVLGIDLRMSEDMTAFVVAAGSTTSTGSYLMAYLGKNNRGSSHNTNSALEAWYANKCDKETSFALMQGYETTMERRLRKQRERRNKKKTSKKMSAVDTKIVASREKTFSREAIMAAPTANSGVFSTIGDTDRVFTRNHIKTPVYQPFVDNKADNLKIDDMSKVDSSWASLGSLLEKFREAGVTSYHQLRFRITGLMGSCNDVVTISQVCRLLGIDKDSSRNGVLTTNELRRDIVQSWNKYLSTQKPNPNAHSPACGCHIKRSIVTPGLVSRPLAGVTLRLIRSYTKWTVLNVDKAMCAIESICPRKNSVLRHDIETILGMVYGFGFSGVVGMRLSRDYMLNMYGITYSRRSSALRALRKAGVLKVLMSSNQLKHRATTWAVSSDFIDFGATSVLRKIRYNSRVDNTVPSVLHKVVIFDGYHGVLSVFDGEYSSTDYAPTYMKLTEDMFTIALNTMKTVNVTNQNARTIFNIDRMKSFTISLQESVRITENIIRRGVGHRTSLYGVSDRVAYDNYDMLKVMPSCSKHDKLVDSGVFDREKYIVQPILDSKKPLLLNNAEYVASVTPCNIQSSGFIPGTQNVRPMRV